jgi:L-aminopeptidase/D-esterase-like protein
MFGSTFAVKGGLGTASHKVPGADIDVSAIVVVNAVGDIDNPDTRQIFAGARQEEGRGFRDAMSAIMGGYRVVTSTSSSSNTTIGAVATNVPFNKAKMTKIAWMAHGGFARSINPVHTMSDGDAIFTLFTGKALSIKADVLAISAIPATVMAQAVPVRLFKPRVWPTINSLPIETM